MTIASKRVFVTRVLPAPARLLLDESDLTVRVFERDRPITADELMEGVDGCVGLLAMCNDAIGAEVMDRAHLKVIANMAVGFDNIELEAARARGIVVTNTPGVLTAATADLTMALLLAVARRLLSSDRHLRAGKFVGWGPQLFSGADLYGQRLGIVGPGRIGRAVAERARAFGLEVVFAGREPSPDTVAFVSFPELLTTSDFVSLHCPLTPQTRHLIDAAALEKMKPSAFLINTARGAVVDEAALVRALRAGRIAGAALDVFEDEPRVQPGLLDLDNVVLTPHVGSATESTRGRMASAAVRDMVAVLSGQSPTHPAW